MLALGKFPEREAECFELRRWQVRGSRVRPKRLPFLLVGEDSVESLVEEIAAEGFGGRRHPLHVFAFAKS
jgi:hypothetical protein